MNTAEGRPALAVGLKHSEKMVVAPRHTVPQVAEWPGFENMPAVFATAMMVGFMEQVCITALRPYLSDDQRTVGTQVNMSHVAATPVGMSVTAQVELIEIDGQSLVFKVSCHDDAALIGEGSHRRAIIDLNRFNKRLEAKATAAGVAGRMTEMTRSGLGELLRYVGELIDQGAEEQYRAMGLDYRARYTPVLRALLAGAETISDITALSRLTQGAVSQSVTLMVADGLVARHALQDGRKTGVRVTPKGKKLLKTLVSHWDVTFAAIEALEKEIGYPLRHALENAAKALEREGFAARLRAAKRAAQA